MIVGLGVDIAELDRIRASYERFGDAFCRRILTPRETECLPDQPVAYLASRFAAKEAAVKALGTGFSQGVGFQDIEIRSEPSGQPVLVLHGRARMRADDLMVNNVHLSISHGRDNAVAVVVLERDVGVSSS